MVRQKEIAEKTGFSLSVVSRALSQVKGKNDTLSEETREIVRRAAEEMGYKPNLQASSLRKGKLPVIGVFLPNWGGSLISELIMGISDAARDCELPLSFYFDMSLDSYGKFLEAMKNQGNSGILSYYPRFNDGPNEKIMKKLYSFRNDGGKIVMLNTFCYQKHDFHHVSIDEAEGGRIAADYLISKGCNSFISIYYRTRLYMSRLEAFLSRLSGNVSRKLYPLPGPAENEYTELAAIADSICLSCDRGNFGIFSATDIVSRYILFYAAKRGIVPGTDFHIVSYDRASAEPEPYEPPRIIQPFYEVGFRGFMKLHKLINGQKEENEILYPILREGSLS